MDGTFEDTHDPLTAKIEKHTDRCIITEHEYNGHHLKEVLSKKLGCPTVTYRLCIGVIANPSPFLLLKEPDDRLHFLLKTINPLV